jgi:hypothetical protein
MKFLKDFTLICIFTLLLFLKNVSSQNEVVSSASVSGIYSAGDSCYGAGQEIHDDGSFENIIGFSSISEARLVLKFRPVSYPWKFNKFCFEVNKVDNGATNLNFDLIFYDTTGVDGLPNNVVYTLTNQVVGPILTSFNWFSIDISASPVLNSGACYIGIKFNPQTQGVRKLFGMDQRTSTSLWPGFIWMSSVGYWRPVQSMYGWENYKCFGMRTIGESVPSGITGITYVPREYKLYQNYPNPFNPVTRICFDVAKQEFISLKIYDVMGREVKTLVSEVKLPGSYSIDFDCTELSGGVYFYRLTVRHGGSSTGEFTDTKKLLLIK